MNIPEKYRERYDRLAASHPWMREMRDGETNGIDGGTNGIADDSPLVDELPEGDAAYLLRKLSMDFESDVYKRDECDYLKQLADMVERGYVSREKWSEAIRAMKAAQDAMEQARDERDELSDKIGEITEASSELMKKQPYTFGVHDVPGSLRTVGRYIDELTAERDELKSRHCPHYHVDKHYCDVHETQIAELIAERDEWKAKALDYEHKLNVELACSDKSIIEALESHNRELKAERDEYRNMAGKMLDAAQEIRRIADASMPEGARAVM